jgi:hypothetical protein
MDGARGGSARAGVFGAAIRAGWFALVLFAGYCIAMRREGGMDGEREGRRGMVWYGMICATRYYSAVGIKTRRPLGSSECCVDSRDARCVQRSNLG